MNRIDIPALLLGLLFTSIAALGLARGLGAPINWNTVWLAAPAVLIALGALGLVLNRKPSRHTSWEDR